MEEIRGVGGGSQNWTVRILRSEEVLLWIIHKRLPSKLQSADLHSVWPDLPLQMSSYTTVNKTPSSCRLRGESTVEVKLKVQLCFLLNADVSVLTSSHDLSSSPFVRKVDVYFWFPALGLEVKWWIVSDISKKTFYFTLKKLFFSLWLFEAHWCFQSSSKTCPSNPSFFLHSFPFLLVSSLLSFWVGDELFALILIHLWLESPAGQRSFDGIID